MSLRKRLLSSALVLLCVMVIPACLHARAGAPEFFGELEPRLYTAPELMSVTGFKPISLKEAEQAGAKAQAGDMIYSGAFKLPGSATVQNTYQAIIVRSPGGSDVLYVDEDRDGRFEPNERVLFLPVVNPEFARMKDMASFDVDLPPGGFFRTCPLDVALMKKGDPGQVKPPELAVEYTSTAFVRGFAVLPDQRLMVRFEYDFDAGGVSLTHGREWLDLNNDGAFDLSAGSPEALQAHGSAPVFQAGGLKLQVKSVDLSRDRFVLREVPTGPRRTRWHWPFQK